LARFWHSWRSLIFATRGKSFTAHYNPAQRLTKLRTFLPRDRSDLGFRTFFRFGLWQQRFDFPPRHLLHFGQEPPEGVGNYLAWTVPGLVSLLTPCFDHRQDQFFRWGKQDRHPSSVVWQSFFPSHGSARIHLPINHSNVIMTLWKALVT